MQKQVHGIISGRVQMVMFRDFIMRKATKLGLTGFVRNISDGTVEFIAEGEEDSLATFIAQSQKGPVLAEVKNVQVEWKGATNTFIRFSISYE